MLLNNKVIGDAMIGGIPIALSPTRPDFRPRWRSKAAYYVIEARKSNQSHQECFNSRMGYCGFVEDFGMKLPDGGLLGCKCAETLALLRVHAVVRDDGCVYGSCSIVVYFLGLAFSFSSPAVHPSIRTCDKLKHLSRGNLGCRPPLAEKYGHIQKLELWPV